MNEKMSYGFYVELFIRRIRTFLRRKKIEGSVLTQLEYDILFLIEKMGHNITVKELQGAFIGFLNLQPKLTSLGDKLRYLQEKGYVNSEICTQAHRPAVIWSLTHGGEELFEKEKNLRKK